ncbi:MAG TPA: methyltransferase [Streptosporangiaceae bacterium]
MSSQYFAEEPDSPHRPGLVHVVLPDVHLALVTDSGVFSPGRLDPGTRLLLDVAPAPPARGDLLDLGCGYGALALVLASRAPAARIWAVDTNRRAIALCERNAGSSGLSNVQCVAVAGVTAGESSPQAGSSPDDDRLPGRYDLIWSNPPIRIGKQALHSLLAHWLTQLAPGAPAYLVVQRNLGSDSLQRWLESAGWTADRYAARAGYRVLEVRRDS